MCAWHGLSCTDITIGIEQLYLSYRPFTRGMQPVVGHQPVLLLAACFLACTSSSRLTPLSNSQLHQLHEGDGSCFENSRMALLHHMWLLYNCHSSKLAVLGIVQYLPFVSLWWSILMLEIFLDQC